jgi:hypothetical protein
VAFLRRHGLAAAVVVAALAAAVAIIFVLLPGGGGPVTVRLSAAPLGVNVAPWDGVYASGPGADVIQPKLAAAGIRQLRFGGGSYADYYDWQTNSSIGNCLPGNTRASFTAGCSSPDQLSFGQFSARARAVGAESFVTVNYGSGTPALAAAWVTAAIHTAGGQVALWEVGNESYGCYEVNNPLAGAPVRYQGYQPGTGSSAGQYQSCPTTKEGPVAGTKTLATSYAANALPFLRAMKAADPSARLGVPWLLSVPGAASVSSAWNDTVLGRDARYVDFVDAHYYPFSFSGATGGANPTDAQVLAALPTIAAAATSIKSSLAARDPGAAFVIGETAPSSAPTTTACSPVGAVFAAGDVLSWLAAGAQTVDWWDLNNYGNSGASCTQPDYGLFTSAPTPAPETAYYGYLLASALARPGAELGVLATSASASSGSGSGSGSGSDSAGEVLAFQSALPGGRHAVAFVNLDTGAGHTITFTPPSGFAGTLRSSVYAAGSQNDSNSRVITGTTSAASATAGISLPAESVTVLETQ